MTDMIQKTKHPCWAEFKCHYKVDNSCVFWDQIKTRLSALQEKYHKNESCILDLFDTFREPCLEQDEEGRKRGVTDIQGP
jgi:acyl-CoA-binding protein